MVKIINKENFLPNFDKSVHYISWTPYLQVSYSQMVYSDAAVRLNIKKIDPEVIYNLVDTIENTQTLHPMINITLIPNRSGYSDDEEREFIRESIKIQNEKVKSDNLIFDIRSLRGEEIIEVIEEECEKLLDNKDTNVYIIELAKFLKKQYEEATEKEIMELERQNN